MPTYPPKKRRAPRIPKGLQDTMSSIATLERAISRVLLLRFQQDIARLYSARLYNVSQVYIPQLMRQCLQHVGPGWFLTNYDQEDIRDLFRGAIAMDLRQAGERTATKSILWSYTALRHFAMSHDVHICKKRGLHSLHLLPFYPYLKAHLDSLENLPHPTFCKPPQLGPLTFGLETVEQYTRNSTDKEWKAKIRLGYYRLVDTLWSVAREFDVRGYGLVLREKLTDKWCDCGCSTDHLGEVCEKTVREDESEVGRRPGKEREWDGRGSGVYGWNTLDEEDLWEVELDFGGFEPGPELHHDLDCEDTTSDMTIGELMEWRYIRAEKSKEMGNVAFRKGDYDMAAKYYKCAHGIEPELPHYQLNLAAAQLKLGQWMEAEKSCTGALSQHRSTKGYYRRARARRMQNKFPEAARDLRAVLKIQPSNMEALTELASLSPELRTSKIKADRRIFETFSDIIVDDLASQPSSSTSFPPSPSKHPPSKLDVPFDLSDRDRRRIRIIPLPLTVEIPGTGGTKESISYPSWDRYMVKLV